MKTLYGLIFLMPFLMWSCIEPVAFDAEEPEVYLIVDGLVSAGSNKHIVKLATSGALDKRVFNPVLAAQVTLVEEGGPSANFTEIIAGTYELETTDINVETGKSYYLDIVLSNGKSYRSNVETVPALVPVDSLSFSLESTQIVNEFGNILTRNFVLFSANFKLSESEVSPFLRWQVQDIYLVSEKVCGPLDNAESCYIYPPDLTPRVNTLNGTNFAPGVPFRQELVEREIDYVFGERYSLSVFQIAHTRAALDFWSKVDQVVSLEGSVFDIAPAPIQGNVFNVDDPNETVLGYFAATAIDTAHIFLTRFDVADLENVSNYCGPPEQPVFQSPPECCNCLSLANSTLERPDFW